MNRPQIHTSGAPLLLHIRHADDVLVILEAVRQGILPLVTQRLGPGERDALKSGNVFVWEEDQREGGLVRWTDGRKWSQSKVCGDCLLYHEKVDITDQEREAKAKRRVERIFNPGTAIPPPPRNLRPSKSDGLTKQTYSFLVQLPGSSHTRRWHTVSYTLWSERGSLPVIGDYPELRNIRIPGGVFTRSKASDNVNQRQVSGCPDRQARGPNITLAPRRIPRAIVMHQPCGDGATEFGEEGMELPSFNPGRRDTGRQTVLPPITRLSSTSHCRQVLPQSKICPEDRRILDSFKLRL
ncbi:Gti1/Pac2 family-domain-containing protein [Roridomyces roridus]|uniref:Gti1/Pac2 family-domain-containing protein n=1 Tax=Roridomyces roridus TaxID=1738132 RepID=A0AAD7FIJ3_9AGAR|nr:Gti1/Pac2 family-domain-containing protein [Roridomyces roridus]